MSFAAMGPPAQTPRKQVTNANGLPLATPLKTPLRTPGGYKVEQTSSTPIIDFNAIESQKENVQPLARGRSAHALSNTLNMQHKQRQAILAAQRKEHEEEVNSRENVESDDPLEAWTRYVKWCIDNYPSGQTNESGLVPLLEKATRMFKDSEQYIHDSRYLRLWILYARNVECARDVYNFLLANEIGTKLASLYEELAVVLEGQNMFEEADSMYKLGIARRANPIDRLKRRYAEYQQRILLHPQVTTSTPQNYAEALKAAMASCGRSVLGHKDTSTAGPARSNAANVLRGVGAGVGAIGGTACTVNNGRKMAVYQDGDEGGWGAVGGPSGRWDDLGTVSSRKQENQHADRLGKSFKIGASGGVAKKPGSGLAVFRDSDDSDGDDTPAADGAAASVLAPKDLFSKSPAAKKAPTETDLLRKNPFLNWDAGAKLTPDPADLSVKKKAESTSSTHKSSADKVKKSNSSSKSSSSRSVAASSSSSSRQERQAAPLKLMYPGIASLDEAAKNRGRNGAPTDEVCLEELLAKQRGVPVAAEDDPWAYLDAVEGQWLPRLDGDDELEEEEYIPEPQKVVEEEEPYREDEVEEQIAPVEEESTPIPTPEPTKSIIINRDHFDPDNSADNGLALQIQRLKKKGRPEPTMTMMTKAAMAEVENMFNGDDSDSDSDDDESSEDDDNMMAPPVPPTPTPASRYNDENAGVRATPMKMPALGMRTPLGATPMRTPLGLKTPSSAKPVYQDEEEDDEYNVPAAAAIPCTPAPSYRQPAARRTFEPMAEEDEESEEDYQEYPHHSDFGRDFHQLSTIKEATYEMTRTTNMRTPGTMKSWKSGRSESMVDEEQTGDQLKHQIDRGLQERSFSDDHSSATFETWESGKANFELAEGLTIARDDMGLTEQFGKSFVIEEQSRRIRDFAPPNPCSPVDAEMIEMILASLSTPIESLENYIDLTSHSAEGRLSDLQKRAKSNLRRSISANTDWTLEIDDTHFTIREKLGEGGYGAVFLAEDPTETLPDQSLDEDDDENNHLVAVKVESPPNKWEFYILDQLRRRLDSSILPSIIGARRFYAYQDESFMLLNYGSQGTLLEVVNQASVAGVASMGTSVGGGVSSGVDEVLAMFFTIELLKVVEAMHSTGLIHGDLKIDNCLLRLDEPLSWSNHYNTPGWESKGLTLIDFGRAMDLSLFPEGQQFIADWQVDARDCQEMRQARPFTYQTDYHGIASIAYCLLFGKYIEVTSYPDPENDRRQRYKIAGGLRRYWQVDLWGGLFELLLNPGPNLPITEELKRVRIEMQTWLEANCNRGGKNLKGLIRKLEIWAMKRSG